MKISTRIALVAAVLSLLFVLPCLAQSEAPARALAGVKKGMTWKLFSTNAPTGTIRVGCDHCDAYQGDTPCTTELPILCIKKDGPGFPLPVPASVNNTDQYYKWSGGVVGTTRPTAAPAKRADANALCVKEFGPGFRVAEHHDGWGWHFQAYGGVGDPAKPFWVDINDQPAATCWN